ncbi:MAG: GNAT family N-acetyltransferase [Halolamina sp.]
MSESTFIDADRIELRPPEEADIPFLQEGVNHPEIRRYISRFRTPFSEHRYREEAWPPANGDDGVSLLAVPKQGEFAGEPVGSVQLYPLHQPDAYANFGVWFHPDAWGNGYALEASAHLIDHGFRERRIHRVSATVMDRNDASRRLCDRLGFVHEGTAREAQFTDGKFVDAERYGLLEAEWDRPEAVLD